MVFLESAPKGPNTERTYKFSVQRAGATLRYPDRLVLEAMVGFESKALVLDEVRRWGIKEIKKPEKPLDPKLNWTKLNKG
jgi:hypothetical protein